MTYPATRSRVVYGKIGGTNSTAEMIRFSREPCMFFGVHDRRGWARLPRISWSGAQLLPVFHAQVEAHPAPRYRARMNVKDVVRRVPVLGSLALRGSGFVRRYRFKGSKQYWEQRYQDGGTSGQGSMSHLASFKADTLNAFVASHDVQSVIEFGCGDGRQLALARYPRYIGLDVSPSAIRQCGERYRDDATKSFLSYVPDAFFDRARVLRADMSLSLDVIFHLVEDAVFDGYMRYLFAAGARYVAIFSSDRDEPSFQPHVRHRKFTEWVKANAPEFRLIEQVQNPHKGMDPATESFADFAFYQRDSSAT
jgi:SAM-dependent methyltransferase